MGLRSLAGIRSLFSSIHAHMFFWVRHLSLPEEASHFSGAVSADRVYYYLIPEANCKSGLDIERRETDDERHLAMHT